MTEAVQVALIAAAGPTLIGCLTLLHQVFTGRKQLAKTEEIHKATNSLADRLIATTKLEAHAAGVKEEKERAAGKENQE